MPAHHDSEMQGRTAMGCLGLGHGLFVLVTAVCLAVAAFILFGLLETVQDAVSEQSRTPPAIDAVPWLMNRPLFVALLTIPAAVVGLLCIVRRRTGLVMIALETVLLLIPFAVLMFVFLSVMAQLYTITDTL